MHTRKTLDDLIAEHSAGSIILVRADLNVPIDASGQVRDATRLTRLLPTLKELTDAGMKIGVLGHFGRPNGRPVPEMSLSPVATALGEVLGQAVTFAEDCIGDKVATALKALPDGNICVLENTRYHAGEEANDGVFAAVLAASAGAYVNDAFSASHRAHASIVAITAHLPSYCGRAMQAELAALEVVLANPERPLVAVIGGAKISTKIDLLGNLSRKVDVLVIGGGMANTFLAALGKSVGISLCETTMFDTARDILGQAKKNKCRILLPKDVQLAAKFAAGQNLTTASVDAVPQDQMILDVGPQSVAEICTAFDKAATLIWNGPLGAFEIEPFDAATNQAARHAAALTHAGKLESVAGGGDTLAALNHAGVAEGFSYVSTAGGAFLEWLEGKTLPGVEALNK